MKNSLARPLAETDSPVFALDPRRTIVYCNPALLAWLGVTAEQLLGKHCDYAAGEADDPVGAALAALAIPPEAFEGSRDSGHLLKASPEGIVRRGARFTLLPQQGENWVVAVVDPADENETASVPLVATSHDELHRQVATLRLQIQRRYRVDRLYGDSPAARRIREQVRIAIDSRARTVIIGPPGSGREHLARTIHAAAREGERPPLLPLQCALLDAELIEAAIESFLRQSDADDRATILLQDVERLASDGQATLARLLVGSRRPIRTLTTARRPFQESVGAGAFREDLAAWLGPLVIDLPGLVARREDVPVLAQSALEDFNATGERQLSGFHPEALDALVAYAWPNNFDELRAAVWDSCRRATATAVQLADLPESIRRALEPTRPDRVEEPIELDRFLEDVEREVIGRALRRSKGNKAQAARMLGIPRVRLLRRIEQLGVP